MSDDILEDKALALENGVCQAHGPFRRDMQWLLLSVKNVLKLAWVSTGILLGIFGAVLKFGMEMTGSARAMQEQMVSLKADIVRVDGDAKARLGKLEATDDRICVEIDKLKDKHRGGADVSTNR